MRLTAMCLRHVSHVCASEWNVAFFGLYYIKIVYGLCNGFSISSGAKHFWLNFPNAWNFKPRHTKSGCIPTIIELCIYSNSIDVCESSFFGRFSQCYEFSVDEAVWLLCSLSIVKEKKDWISEWRWEWKREREREIPLCELGRKFGWIMPWSKMFWCI